MSRPKHKMADKAKCRSCGERLWAHPRCVKCDRFIWCTARQQTDRGPCHVSCPVRI